ncbi:MAG TPA: transporter substrate-binding domain-containing protein [Ohtaekwangia sp.]|uniref:transglycosylase SLT domain-containing protein n=1 Tax=Ohtaekwangia sp. TaxID=2066019 RepID=UPI002F93C18A
MAISCNPTQKEGFSSETAVSLDLDAIRKRGYLNALVDNNSISYFIYKGRPMGYEYELLQLLAKDLNVGLKIKVTNGVESAIDQLNRGEGDIIAFPMTINKPRKERVSFTRPLFNTYQVLVQRKPDNWRKLNDDQINAGVIRTPAELGGKDVYVIKGTSHEIRMHNLSEEIGSDILIHQDTITAESESLIRKVSAGEIDYTVADHTMAQVNAAYYPNLDVNTVLSVPQQIAWGVRKNSSVLLETLDQWLGKIKKEPTFMVIYNRYFKSPRTSLLRMKSDYFSYGSNRLSPYDDLIKAGATELQWDWRLLAAVVYQESKFNPNGESWAGARGLMQLMPETAKRFGAHNLNDPKESLHAGVRYLKYLDKYWTKSVPDSVQRLKFILASYNAGLSHILDAKKLLLKYGKDKDVTRWDDNVQVYLLKKSESKFYRDPVVTAGYCKCEEPVNYIQDVFDRFEEYKTHIKDDLFDENAIRSAVTSN